MAFFLSLTHIGSRVNIYFLTHKSWKHRQSPLHSKAKNFFCSFGLNEALYGITSMSQPYNMVNYGVSQLLTNVIKHKGITTTLAKCVTRCKHHFCSLCPFFDLHCYPPSMSQPIQHGQLWCLTTFDQCHQAYGNNYYFGKVCDQMQTLHLQSVAFFALHFYHPPTPTLLLIL